MIDCRRFLSFEISSIFFSVSMKSSGNFSSIVSEGFGICSDSESDIFIFDSYQLTYESEFRRSQRFLIEGGTAPDYLNRNVSIIRKVKERKRSTR